MDCVSEEGYGWRWWIGLVVFFLVGWALASGGGKAQWVRLVDVFLYGPYLVYLSAQVGGYVFSEGEKVFLLFLGATTISYNARNYLSLR
jgi:hypothetical protein